MRYPSGATAVDVTIDGRANDGEITPTHDGRTRIDEGAGSEGDNVDTTNERVTATERNDTVEGDAASNSLEGSAGEDYLAGGGGADRLSGGGRGDMIFSRDRIPDRVACGPGYDYVVADGRDLYPSRSRECEYIDDGSRSGPRAVATSW